MSVEELLEMPGCEMAVRGKFPLARAWGEGGARVGVRGRLPVRLGGANVKGEYSWPCLMYGSAKLTAGVRRVGVMGILEGLKKVEVQVPRRPGDIGTVFAGGNMNFVSIVPLVEEVVGGWDMCSPFVALGGVALPLLRESVLGAMVLAQLVSISLVVRDWEDMTPGYCHTGDRIPDVERERERERLLIVYLDSV